MTTFIVLMAGCYFLPAIVAHLRKHEQKTPITLLNLFLGWTLLGWVAALVWASMRARTAGSGTGPVGA